MAEDRKLQLRASNPNLQPVRMEYACWSRAGADPRGRAKPNQDAFVVKEGMAGSNTCFFGVFDGHGSDGAKVSRHLATAVPRLIASCEDFRLQRYRNALQAQIPACNRQLADVPYINSRLSGSTAVTALLEGSGLLTVANVGDSRCMLGRVSGGRLQVAALNTDHNPDVPEEAARILASKGRIAPYRFDGVPVGPKRVWLANEDLPGLSMTRALGDQIGATVGVSAEPEITQVMLTHEDRYLVLCSDGLFEFMDNEYIMAIIHHQVSQGWHPADIAKCLVAEATRQWMEEEDGIIDDCTVIIVVLDMPRPGQPATPPQPPPPTPAPAPASPPPGPAPLADVACAMHTVVARQSAGLLASDALPSVPSLTKLRVRVGQ